MYKVVEALTQHSGYPTLKVEWS